MRHILIIEDDLSILRGLKHNLEFEGYSVSTAEDGKTGLEKVLSEDIDLLLLDIMLPELSGYDICRNVKERRPELPVVMLTARGQEVDKIAGLDLGADDYITKPFSVPELLARIRAVLRRVQPARQQSDTYSFGNITLDFKKYVAKVRNKEIDLTSREFGILKYLVEREGEVIHRHELLDNVWGYENYPTTRTVDNYILNLRKKLENNPAHPKHILSIRGVGYKFVP